MLIVIAAIAIIGDVIFLSAQPDTFNSAILAICLFGGAIFSLYPVAVAHANDHAPVNDFVRTSGGLLLLFGMGSIVGPLLASLVISTQGSKGLLPATIVPHVLILLFAAWRLTQRAAVDESDKSDFVPTTPLRTPTQTVVLASSQADAGNARQLDQE